MSTPLVPDESVDLVDDHRPGASEHPAPSLAREEQVQRLWSRDEDMGRSLGHRGTLTRRRVARAHEHPDFWERSAAHFRKRSLEVLLDIVRKGAERRDIDDLSLIGERLALAEQGVNGREEGRERLA